MKMTEQKERYWKRYELATSLIAERVLKTAESKRFKDNDELEKFVRTRCNSGFISLDFMKDSFVTVFVILDNYNIVGVETSVVYEVYKNLCNEMNYEVISKVDFSRFICKYFGYAVVDKKVNGRKCRMFVYI